MDHQTDKSIIANAVLKIVNYPPKPRSDSTSVEDEESGLQCTSQQDSASLLAHNDNTGPQAFSVNRPALPEDHHLTFDTSHQLTRKAPFFVRPSAPDDVSTTPFAYTKHQLPTFNLKPSRGPAATGDVDSNTKDQLASSGFTKSSEDDAASSEAEEQISKMVSPRSEEPESDSAQPEASASLNPRQQSSSNLNYPQSVPTLQNRENEKDTSTMEDKSPTKGVQHALDAPKSPTMERQTHPDLPITGSVPDTLEQEIATPEQQTVNQERDDRHDGDTEMLDENTLIDAETPSHTSARNHPHSPSPSKQVPARPRLAGKVRKPLKGFRAYSPSLSKAGGPPTDDSLYRDPEELLKALTVHYQYQKQQRDQFRAREQGRDRDIQDLQTISQALHQQLQESENQVANQGEELNNYRQIVPRFKDRLKKLSDFVKGLSNDHARLRDLGDSIQAEQKTLQMQKGSMTNLLKETVGAMEDERVQHQERTLKLRHKAKILEQALNTRSLDLLSENSRLRAEQGRNTNLQEHLLKSALQYERLTAQLVQHEAALGSKIAGLRDLVQSAAYNTQPADQGDLSKKLEECLQLLREPPAAQLETSDIVHKLDLSNKEYAESISRLISACGSSTEATIHLESKLASQLEAKLEKLISIIETGHPLREQIMDLREMRATVTEQLKATETSLVDSRLKLTTFENRDQSHLQKICALEAEVKVLRNQTQESPLSALRLHEAEKQCLKVKEQLSTCQSQFETTKADIEIKRQEASDLHDLLETTKANLAEQQAKAEVLMSEKAAVERQAVHDEERIRAELSQACKNEVSRITNKFLNEIQGLRHQLLTTGKKLEMEKSRAEQLQTERAAALDDAGRTESSINELRRQANASRDTISQLKQTIEEAHQQKTNMERELEKAHDEVRDLQNSRTQEEGVIQSLRSRLDNAESLNIRLDAEKIEAGERLHKSDASLATANARLKAQDARICELMQKFSNANNPNPASTSSPLRPIESNRSCKKASVVVDDSQDRGPKQRPGILKLRTVIEDSQNRDPQERPGLLKSRPIVEDSQGKGDDTHRQRHRLPSSSDELSREDPLSYMPKEIQDLVAGSSSPLTDVQPASSPVIDGGVMFPPSPMAGQRSNPPVKEAPRLGSFTPPGSANHRESPNQGNIWAYNTSMISTKSHSVTASLLGRSPSRSSHFATDEASQSRSVGHLSPHSFGIKQSESQLSHQSHQNLKRGGLKRAKPAASIRAKDPGSHHKRLRLSSETEKLGLGPTQNSPVKSAGSSRRKSSLRHSQRDDKYSQRFQLELTKER
ncbi:MAG: hypothetical protein Q9225_000401 [Loekoesia sp. 1 TL-2023]